MSDERDRHAHRRETWTLLTLLKRALDETRSSSAPLAQSVEGDPGEARPVETSPRTDTAAEAWNSAEPGTREMETVKKAS
jgi:hypothetical protein